MYEYPIQNILILLQCWSGFVTPTEAFRCFDNFGMWVVRAMWLLTIAYWKTWNR